MSDIEEISLDRQDLPPSCGLPQLTHNPSSSTSSSEVRVLLCFEAKLQKWLVQNDCLGWDMWSPCSNSCNPPSTTVLCCFTKGTHIQGGLIGNAYSSVWSFRYHVVFHDNSQWFYCLCLCKFANKNILKVIVVGDPGVGKTSFIHRFTSNTFCEDYQGTIEVDFSTAFFLASTLIPSQQAPLELTFQPPC